MIDFFISYAREDGDFARALVSRLEKHEWDTWIDEKDIPPSVPWMTEIQHAMAESMLVVAVESPDWQASEACRIEIDLANQERVPVIRVPVSLAQLDDAVAQVVREYRALPAWRAVTLQATAATAIWAAGGRPRALLVRGGLLRAMTRTLRARPDDFSASTTRFVVSSRQAAIRRWFVGVALGVIVPVLGAGIYVSVAVAGEVDARVAKNVKAATAAAERDTYAKWDLYSGMERSPARVDDSYSDYYRLFSLLAERAPVAWDPAASMKRGPTTAVSPDGTSSASIRGATIEIRSGDADIVRTRASAPVTSLAWSPDSRWIAVTTRIGADVLSVANGQVIPLRGGSGDTRSVSWRDFSRVVVRGTSGSGIWRVFDGTPVAHVDGVRYGASVSGSLYTVSASGAVTSTDTSSGASRAVVGALPPGSTPGAMDASGSTIAIGYNADVPFLRLIDAKTKATRDIRVPGCSPVALSLSPDASTAYLACGDASVNRTRVDLATGKVTSRPLEQQIAFGVRALDDRVLWGGYYGLISQTGQDLEPRGTVTTTAGCGSPIRKLVGPSDGGALFQIGDATGSFSCATRIELHGKDPGQVEVHRLVFPSTDGHAVPDAATSPDGSLIAYGLSDGRIRVFTSSGFVPVYFGQVLPDQVRSVSFSPDGSALIVVGLGGEVVSLTMPSGAKADRGNALTADALAELQRAVDWGIYTSTMPATK